MTEQREHKTWSQCSDQSKKTNSLYLRAALTPTCVVLPSSTHSLASPFWLKGGVCTCVCVSVCVCGWPLELQTGLHSAVTAHWHHNTLTPFTMLSFSPSLFALSPVLTTGLNSGYSQGKHRQIIHRKILPFNNSIHLFKPAKEDIFSAQHRPTISRQVDIKIYSCMYIQHWGYRQSKKDHNYRNTRRTSTMQSEIALM